MEFKYQIDKEMERFSLQDARFESVAVKGDHLTMEFNWAYLSHVKEYGLDEAAVLGASTLELIGCTDISITLDFRGIPGHENKETISIPFSETIFEEWKEVLETKVNEAPNSIQMSGFYVHQGVSCWLKSTFNCAKLRLGWNSHMSHADWTNSGTGNQRNL